MGVKFKRPFTRAMHFDFHTMPGHTKLMQGFDAEAFADKLQENHVKYINFTARCNIGFSYYDTKVGKKYPGLQRDLLKEVIDACHKRDIGVTAYLNAGLNHEAMIEHLDWCRVDKNGRVYQDDKVNNFFRMVCYNSGYGNHLLEEIKEIAAYDVDGIFCDCMVLRGGCYCPACTRDMITKGIDIHDENAAIAYQNQLRKDFAKRIKGVVNKDVRLFFNSNWVDGYTTHAEIECLSSSMQWGRDFFYATAPYARTRIDELVYMSGRFQCSWGDFGGITNLASMQGDLYDAMLNGYELSFGDHLHPIDGLEDEVIERVGKVFAEQMLYEPYIKGAKAVVEVGVLVADIDHYDAWPYQQGIARMFCELKIPYNFYNEYGDFSKMKLMVIPQKTVLSENLKQKLKDFRDNGGKMLFCGDALDVAKELGCCDYVDVVGADTSDNAYFLTKDSNMRWAIYKPKKLMKNVSGEETAKYVGNIFNFEYDGLHAYFYRPQGKVTDYSVAVTDGDTACVCFDVFIAYKEMCLTEHKKLISDLINRLLPRKFIEVDGLPASAIIGVTETAEHRIVHVKTTYAEIRNGRGIIEDHTWHPGANVSMEGEYQVSVLPSCESVGSCSKDGRTVFNTGNIIGYKAFLLKKIK
jgi:hypothetical protein